MEITLNIFTLNCWGIPGISKNRKERIEAIAKYLCEEHHNIVCLQEIWSESDFIYMKDHVKSILPYSHYFYSGVLGSGLCVFSKWVIEDVFFHQWPLNGYIHKIHHGDWFGGKGVGLCRIRCGDKLVNVYCTHLHAEYHERDAYLVHRVLQAHEAAQLVRLTRAAAAAAVLAGDLNAQPQDLAFSLLTEVAGLRDAAERADAAGTSDHAANSYSDAAAAKLAPEGKRIDHILYSVDPALEVHVESYGNPLPARVPGLPFSYSDHNAVSARLRLGPARAPAPPAPRPAPREPVARAIALCDAARLRLARSKRLYLTSGALLLILLLGTVGWWPNLVMYDVLKIAVTGACLYALVMGSLWSSIEMNSLRAGLRGLESIRRGLDEAKEP